MVEWKGEGAMGAEKIKGTLAPPSPILLTPMIKSSSAEFDKNYATCPTSTFLGDSVAVLNPVRWV